MFMGKSELDNMKKLLKIRRRDCIGIYMTGSLLCMSFLTSIFDMIKSVFTYQSEPNLISAIPYSNWALFYTIVACVYYTFQYSEFSERHQIYPQTNSTRFLAFELYLFYIHIFTQALALGFNLLQYLVFFILGQRKGNLAFAYTLNPVFIITGFFTYMLYGFILISLIILISALVRKFRWWTLIVYIGLFLILWFTKDIGVVKSVVKFYLQESSVTLFFIKAILTWMILELLNHILNSYTSASLATRFNNVQIIIASVILFSFLISNLVTYLKTTQDFPEYSFSSKEINTSQDKPYCTLNAGNIPTEATLKTCIDYRQISHYELQYGKSYYNSSVDKIMVYFIPEKDLFNDIDITAYTNPRLEISLQNKKLNIKVIKNKNVKVLSLYPYFTLMHFDCFKDKPYANKYYGLSSGTIPGKIQITTPESKKINIQEN